MSRFEFDAPTASGPMSLRQDRHRPSGLVNLIRAEWRRFRSRKLIRAVLAMVVLGYLVLVPLIAFLAFSKPTPELMQEASQRREQAVAEQNTARADCLKNVATPAPGSTDPTPEQVCGPELKADDFGRVEDFLPKSPFVFGDNVLPGMSTVAGLCAAAFFVIGATWIGAEWSTRTLMAELFWETRRARVLMVKAGVLAATAALFTLAMQVVWAGSAWVIAYFRGSTTGSPKGLTGWAFGQAGRGVLLAVLVALIGYSLVQLMRHTAAALGFAFGYFVVLEPAITIFRSAWQPWLLSTNMTALLSRGGTTLYLPGRSVDESGQIRDSIEFQLSSGRGAITLAALAAVLFAAGLWSFLRRDLT